MIEARLHHDKDAVCDACGNKKRAPVDTRVALGFADIVFVVCQECGRDLANAVGFMCLREGGWSKLEPRKRKAKK